MKVAIVTPGALPPTWGGAERAVDGLRAAIERETDGAIGAEVIRLPVDESHLLGVLAGYEVFANLDVTGYDRVISVKYPAWITPHHAHTLLMFHPLRGLYDTYHYFGQPTDVAPTAAETDAIVGFMRHRFDRAGLPELFGLVRAAVAALGPGHPDLRFPGPLARALVHWLDTVALAPGQIDHHFALSRTVASRADYFPTGIVPRVVYLPSDVPTRPHRAQEHLFTVSRLDGPKRLELLVSAMAHVPHDVPLIIAGRGPEEGRLRQLAGGDERIRFAGFVTDEEVADLYADALAVPFVPLDEDLGLITLEAFGCGAPVVTCRDSGGPTELVVDGITGLVADPDPASLGRALSRLVADRDLARELGRAGQHRASQVTWRRAVHQLVPESVPPDPIRSLRSPAPAAPTAASTPERPGGPGRRPKVAVTATFSIDEARGGGQIRVRRLYGALARHADVEVVCLVEPTYQPRRAEILPGLTETLVPRSPRQTADSVRISGAAGLLVSDIVAGTHIHTSPAYLEALQKAARGAEAVILAEPYLHPAVALAGIDAPVVYDAFNVEATMKADLFPRTSAGRELLSQVVELEGGAMRDASAVTACSGTDADLLARLYDRSRDDIEVIPNGTEVGPAIVDADVRAARQARWLARFRSASGQPVPARHLAVFFGSWHPPNLDAVELILAIAPRLPDVLFACIGSHGQAFADRAVPPNVLFLGVVSDQVKDTLLGCAAVAVNPMRTGSGTNVKLVEYLASGVPVVSTPFGARGLDVVDGEHLVLAAPARFAEAVRATVDDPGEAAVRAAAARRLVEERYDWRILGDRLAGIIGGLRSVVAAPA